MARKPFKGQIINPNFLSSGKVKTFDELVKRWEDFIMMNSTALRNGINRHIKPSLDTYDEYARTLREVDQNQYNLVMNWLIDYQEEIENSQKNFNWTQMIKDLSWITRQDMLQLDHTEYSVVSFRLRVIYEGLLNLQKSPVYLNALGKPIPKKKAKVADIRKEKGINVEIAKPTFTLIQLKKLTEQIRRLFIVAIALRDLKVDDPRTLNEVVTEFINSTDAGEWQLIKQNQIDVFNDKGEIGASLATKDFNERQKGVIERLLGRAASNLIQKRNTTIFNQFNTVKWTELKGSEPVEEEIVRQMSEIARGRKPKASKSKAIKQGRTKTKAKRSKGIKDTATLKKGLKFKRKSTKGPQQRKGVESGETLQEISKIENLINKRLPAEVRRNMGRPALINQTGRFSNSVELENLRPTAKGLSGDFTYQLSPYETFENTGSRRWPTGYNPKPLIAKSIRNLAIQYTSQKLVSLRRK